MARTKPPVSAWIIQQRKLKGWKPAELGKLLRERGAQAEEGTVRTWEAGRSPKPDTIHELERLFGTSAPDTEPSAGDTAAALAAQTDVLRELVAEAREARREQAQIARALTQMMAVVAQIVGGEEALSRIADAAQSPSLVEPSGR